MSFLGAVPKIELHDHKHFCAAQRECVDRMRGRNMANEKKLSERMREDWRNCAPHWADEVAAIEDQLALSAALLAEYAQVIAAKGLEIANLREALQRIVVDSPLAMESHFSIAYNALAALHRRQLHRPQMRSKFSPLRMIL